MSQKKPSASSSNPQTGLPSGAKERNPPQLPSSRVTVISTASSNRARPSASVMSSAKASCGSTGSASAGDTSRRPPEGLAYQVSQTSLTNDQSMTLTPDGAGTTAMLRRLG